MLEETTRKILTWIWPLRQEAWNGELCLKKKNFVEGYTQPSTLSLQITGGNEVEIGLRKLQDRTRENKMEEKIRYYVKK